MNCSTIYYSCDKILYIYETYASYTSYIYMKHMHLTHPLGKIKQIEKMHRRRLSDIE